LTVLEAVKNKGSTHMWWNLASLAIKAGTDVYKNKKATEVVMSEARLLTAEKMKRGEIELTTAVNDNQQTGYKDEVVLAIVILPILVISYSVFSGSPDAKEKLDLFFLYFNNLPDWYVWLTVGIFGSIYGLKPSLDLFKKK